MSTALWHVPLIYEIAHREITPRAGQLVLTSRHPIREHSDKEREARLNREAVASWREGSHSLGKASGCYRVVD